MGSKEEEWVLTVDREAETSRLERRTNESTATTPYYRRYQNSCNGLWKNFVLTLS